MYTKIQMKLDNEAPKVYKKTQDKLIDYLFNFVPTEVMP